VWQEVAALTNQHGAVSRTEAYAGLESSEEFVARRQSYQRFFSDKLTGHPAVVGFVATYEGQVIGADVFAHPDLLQRLYPALLTSYITDAISGAGSRPADLPSFGRSLLEQARQLSDTKVHLAKLP
jgi:hypothetical protein